MIYLDYNATTPLAPEVKSAIVDAMELYGNPSSTHTLGRAAKAAFGNARTQVASLLNATPDEIVLLSGGTESINYALRGAALTARKNSADASFQGHLITSAVEHVAVLETMRYLEREHGFSLTIVGVDATGMVSAEEVSGRG